MDTILAPPTHGERIAAALAAYIADRQMLPGGDLLPGALREVLLVACPDLPISEIPTKAERLIKQARREAQAFEHGETPAAVTR